MSRSMRRRDKKQARGSVLNSKRNKYTVSGISLSPESVVWSAPTSWRGIYARIPLYWSHTDFLCSYALRLNMNKTKPNMQYLSTRVVSCIAVVKFPINKGYHPNHPPPQKKSCKGATFFLFLNMFPPRLVSRILNDGPILCRLKQLPLARDVVGRKLRNNAVCNLFEPFSCQCQDSWSCTW